MRIRQLLIILAVVVSVHVGLAQDASSFKTLYGFAGPPDGSNPVAGLIIGPNGALYGTTNSGGTSNSGTVFSLTPPAAPGGTWTEAVIHDFAGGSDGAFPDAPVVIGKGGVLYGTTQLGGTANAGTVFSLTPPPTLGGTWTESVLHNFTGIDGYQPFTGVVIGKNGVLYGTTSGGGLSWGTSLGASGTVFKLTPPASPGGSWTESLLISFYDYQGHKSDGGIPGRLILKDGVLYGTTVYGSASGYGGCAFYGVIGCGMVFSRTPLSYTVLYNFGGSTGEAPNGGVVIGSGGVLYGTTAYGGTGSGCATPQYSGCGTVFSLTPPTWTEAVLHSFTGGSDGANPYAPVVIGSGGVLYATTEKGGTSGYGTVFSLTPPATPGGVWTETVLHSFTGGPDGAYPVAGLVISEGGVLYGTTSKGGTSHAGTVFALKP